MRVLCVFAAMLILDLAVSAEDKLPDGIPPVIKVSEQGQVTITTAPGCEIRYWVLGPAGTEAGTTTPRSSVKYEAPFTLPSGNVVKAMAIPPDGSPLAKAAKDAVSEANVGAVVAAPKPVAGKALTAGWVAFNPQPFVAVKRESEKHPLSDQENKGGWVKYEALSDEFNGEKLDETKWWPNNPSWKGRYPGLFRKENVTVSGGQMHLTMKKEKLPESETDKKYKDYSCAAVQSKQTVRYGYFEASVRAMKSAGSTAFWMYDTSKPWWTEIDILEAGGKALGKERTHFITMHFWHSPGENKHWAVGHEFKAPANLADDFHVYGLEWDEQELKVFFDGVLVRKGPNTHWHQPQTLNFDSETMPDWFGMPKDEDLPSTFDVEYVRVWKKK
ncbi:MAG TPA: family 16 glycosylhydrolase [Planctomycetota bacterium]|jgi:beta-glucanase (GH16 family)